jgi:regulator of protease activity HflC (stomatin/prohibitin superfamily)
MTIKEFAKKSTGKLITGGLGLLVALGLTARSCSCVPAGHVNVVDFFGSVQAEPLEPGLNWPVNPLTSRVAMDTRTKHLEEKVSVPTKDGLMVDLDVSVLYHLDSEKAISVYKSVGTEYEGVVLIPNLRNVARDVIGGHIPDDLYTANRKVITKEIEDKLKLTYAERGIVLESVLLRNVSLPAQVTSSIEEKVKTKQESEQMKYVIQKENQEAKRKEIEAKGLADAQAIISESLTPAYLQWRNLTTLEGLAGSPNTTFYIIPGDNQQTLRMIPLDYKKLGGKQQ